jgi:hypothetical protein
MGALLLGATGLIALLGPTAPGGKTTLEHLAPATLEPRASSVTLPDSSLGFVWARHGSTLAFVVKPVATGQPIRIADAGKLHTRKVVPVGDRDVCGLTFDHGDLVAITADQPCYWKGGQFNLIRYDSRTWRARQTMPLPTIRSVFPTNLAFGDGQAFVARAGAGLDAIDLRTGVVARHHPSRSLSKGEGIVWTRWLGAHDVSMGAAVVDTRTWRSRILDPTARGVAPAGADLVAFGPRGIKVFTRSGRYRYGVLTNIDVGVVHVYGRYLYAAEGSSTLAHVVDLKTRRETPTSAGANLVWSLLVP